MRSASGGTTRQPRIVPIDNRPVPSEAIFTAVATAMPCFLARVMMAVGSYTAPAQAEGAPAIVRADGEVQRGGQKKPRVIAGLQVAGAHLAAVLGPGFGDIGASQGPLPADTDAGEQAKQA